MFGLAILDVLVGLVTIFGVVSLVASATGEAIAQHLGWRGRILRRSIRDLLGDSEPAAAAFYATQTIDPLRSEMPWYESAARWIVIRVLPKTSHLRAAVEHGCENGRLPSYIAPDAFVRTIFEMTLGPGDRTTDPKPQELASALCFPSGDGGIVDVPAATRDYLARLALACGDDVEAFRHRLADWFNQKMDRTTGVFKRRIKPVLFSVGLVVAWTVNADAIETSRQLWKSSELRAVVVAQAEAVAKDGVSTGSDASKRLEQLAAIFPPASDDPWAWRHILGLLITATAASLGAPFWFDALHSLLKVRASVVPALDKAAGATAPGQQDAAGETPLVTTLRSPVAPAPPERSADALTSGLVGFEPRAARHDPVNARWCAELALLAYQRDAGARGDALQALGLTRCVDLSSGNHQGLVASNDRVVLVAFRGTEMDRDEHYADVLTDANAKPVRLVDEDADAPLVHAGFAAAVAALWSQVQDAVGAATTNGQSLWITGHSLGGAMATLAAVRFARDGRDIAGVYTFGQPRCLTSTSAQSLEPTLGTRIYRYVNHLDPVPALPPALPAGAILSSSYRHLGGCYLFDAQGHVEPNATQWIRYLGFWSRFAALRSVPQLRQAVAEVPPDHRMAMYRELLRG